MKRAAGLLFAASLASSVFSSTLGRAELKCVAWGWSDPAPSSEQVYSQYEQLVTQLPPEAAPAQELLGRAVTKCSNDNHQVGFGVCYPTVDPDDPKVPDLDAPCTDPTPG